MRTGIQKPPRAAAARPAAWLLLAALAAVFPRPPDACAQRTPTEYDVKAVFLLNFIRYTDWPASAFATSNAPIVVGVIGRDPFGAVLENTFSNKTVAGRSIVVKRLTADQDLKPCHLLFVPASEKRRQRELLDSLRGSPVLTVGETEDFLDQGGGIQFDLKDRSVRFSVNLGSAKTARLRVSAVNVLRLASSVRGRYDD